MLLNEKLDRRITIEKPTTTQAADNQTIDTWSTFISCWASVRPTRGNEQIEAEMPFASHTLDFIIRYRTTITEQMRIAYKGKTYQIKSILEIGRNEGLRITAQWSDHNGLQL